MDRSLLCTMKCILSSRVGRFFAPAMIDQLKPIFIIHIFVYFLFLFFSVFQNVTKSSIFALIFTHLFKKMNFTEKYINKMLNIFIYIYIFLCIQYLLYEVVQLCKLLKLVCNFLDNLWFCENAFVKKGSLTEVFGPVSNSFWKSYFWTREKLVKLYSCQNLRGSKKANCLKTVHFIHHN